jgi:hypothetical protein
MTGCSVIAAMGRKENGGVALIFDPFGLGDGNHVGNVRLCRASDMHKTSME